MDGTSGVLSSSLILTLLVRQGFALVGLGSFIFHATLQYEAQLADELPMIYVASYCCAVLFDLQPGFSLTNARTRSIVALLVAFNVLFTWL